MLKYILIFFLSISFFTLSAQPPFYFFEENFILFDFEEVSDGVFRYEDFVLTVDETCTIVYEGEEFTLINQISITGILSLPGGRIRVSGFTEGDGFAQYAELYSNDVLIAEQRLWDSNAVPDDLGGYPDMPLIYENQTSHIIDKLVIRGDDLFTPCVRASFLIRVLMDIPGYFINHFNNPFEDGDDLLSFGGYIQGSSAIQGETFRACADGTESSIFSLSNIESIFYPDQTISVSSIDWKLRVKEDPSGEEKDKYGLIVEDSSSQSDINKIYLYTHPIIPPSNGLDTIHLELFDVNNDIILHEISMVIFPPPILMVHGLWGNPESFTEMENYFKQQSEYTEEELLLRADYESTNSSGFATNNFIIPEHLDSLFSGLHKQGIAVGAGSIIAHSMGGILTRRYLQHPNYIERNDINRIITINTPHSGSQLANFLLDDNISSWRKNVFCGFINIEGGECFAGAVNDLTIGSNEILQMNQPPALNRSIAPIHAITTTITVEELNPEDNENHEEADKIVWISGLSNEGYAEELFNGDQHDIIVAEESQSAGLDMLGFLFTSLFTAYHSEVLELDEIMERAYFLSKQTPNASVFSQVGVKPSLNLTYETPQTFLDSEDENIDVSIIAPRSGEIVEYGSNINFTIEAETETKGLLIVYGERIVNSEGSKRVNGNRANYREVIQPKQLGKLPILVAADADKKGGFTSSYITVTTNEKPSSITPSIDNKIMYQHRWIRPLFKGTFSDFEVIVDGAPNIEYHFKNGYAEYIGDGRIKGLVPGIDTVTVTFNGIVSEPLRLRIGKAEPLPTNTKEISKKVETKALEIQPNLTSESQVTVKIDEISSGILYIWNQSGQVIYKKQYDKLKHNINLNISSFPAGLYYAEFIYDDGRMNGKFVKQ